MTEVIYDFVFTPPQAQIELQSSDLFGHVHTRKNNTGIDAARLQYLYPTQYDVGVDNNNFTPVSFEQVKRIISKQIEKGGR